MQKILGFSNYLAAAAIASLLVLSGLVGAQILSADTVSAQNIKANLCDGAELSVSNKGSCKDNEKCVSGSRSEGTCETASEKKINGLIADVVNIFSVIVGIVAVIMIIIGGFKYITSGGDSNQVSSAKNTIIYAIVGLIIVALAQVIVRFVLNAV